MGYVVLSGKSSFVKDGRRPSNCVIFRRLRQGLSARRLIVAVQEV